MHSVVHGPRRQRGAVIITVCLFLLFLLGFMGIAMDFGRLFIVKTELQTAMDSCALAAAQELDFQASSIDRARSAGKTAGNLNRVNLQSPTWDGKGQIVDGDINFRDANYAATTDALAAKYAECQHTQPSVRLWLLQALGAFYDGNTSRFPATQDVGARAVATRGSAQSICPLPIALKKTSTAGPPLYGFRQGQWVTVIGSRLAGPGEFGWYNLDGSTNARATRDQLEGGACNIRVGDTLGTPGAKTAVDVVWNYRFGIYKNNGDPSVDHPDFSGYAYAAHDWPPGSDPAHPTESCCAFDGAIPPGAPSSSQNFLAKRAQFASYDDAGTSVQDGSQLVFNDGRHLPGGYSTLATPGDGGDHERFGANRRIATVPVIDASNVVIDSLCVFMLQPLSGPNDDAVIEVRGRASDPASPCTTPGLPGGDTGPLVPVLVR
jgi:Flp pilus assembly protein TadG